MNPDAATVIGYSAILFGAICLLFGLFWIREGNKGHYLWFALPFAFGGLAHLLLVEPFVLPGDWGLRLGALFTMLAYAAGWQASRAVNLRKARPLAFLLPCLAWFVVYLQTPLSGTLYEVCYIARIVIMATFNGLSAYEFWRARDERLPSATMLFWLFGVFSAFGFLRSPFIPVSPAPFGTAPTQLWAIVFANLLAVTHALLAAALMVALSRERLAAFHHHMAMLDPLTGIGNRRALERRTSTPVRRDGTSGRGLALLIFDIDHFKRINDRFGHPFGDRVIIKAAEIARTVLRGEDEVFRIGGEEFACILTGVTEQGAIAIAERLRRAFEREASRIDDIQVDATISIGIALPHDDDYDPEMLFDQADAALYKAKHSGRNRTALAGLDPGPGSSEAVVSPI